jgi:hypothetical protein
MTYPATMPLFVRDNDHQRNGVRIERSAVLPIGDEIGKYFSQKSFWRSDGSPRVV